ncbi:hypothetical protein LX36DRAFT_62007 [Colletotrichum falcatum]|nr:hypothetical protein LX36DRAFT_62007 [Colletotrichum falcatum]
MEGHGGAAHLVTSEQEREREKKSATAPYPWPFPAPVAGLPLVTSHLQLPPSSTTSGPMSPPRWTLPPPSTTTMIHAKKALAPSMLQLIAHRSSLFWSMPSIIIIIPLNWIQDTICHRHTWFKRLVCTSHHAIPPSRAKALLLRPPFKGPILVPCRRTLSPTVLLGSGLATEDL